MGVDLTKVREARTQDDKDPELKKNAEQYSRTDWQFTVERLFASLAKDERIAEEIQDVFDDDDFIAIVQDVMVSNKYTVLEASASKKTANKAVGRRW